MDSTHKIKTNVVSTRIIKLHKQSKANQTYIKIRRSTALPVSESFHGGIVIGSNLKT